MLGMLNDYPVSVSTTIMNKKKSVSRRHGNRQVEGKRDTVQIENNWDAMGEPTLTRFLREMPPERQSPHHSAKRQKSERFSALEGEEVAAAP